MYANLDTLLPLLLLLLLLLLDTFGESRQYFSQEMFAFDVSQFGYPTSPPPPPPPPPPPTP